MIDKEILLDELEEEYENFKKHFLDVDSDLYFAGICYGLKKAINLINGQKEKFEWTNSDIVPVGYGYILLSLDNFQIPLFGRYEEDEDGGGAYYICDENESCSSKGLIVNAWMPLPEPYKE